MKLDFNKKEVQSWLDILFNSLHSAILIVNQDNKIQYINHAAEGFFKSSSKACLHQDLTVFVAKKNIIYEYIKEVLAVGSSLIIHDFNLQVCDENKTADIEMAPLGPLGKPSGVITIISEFGLSQSLKEESRVRDRLSMMGTLALGLAHEIRNPLGGIRGAAQMLTQEKDPQEREEYSKMIISEVDRLNALLTQLLDFNKPRKLTLAPMNLNQVLDEVMKLQYIEIHKRLKVKMFLDPSLPLVMADSHVLKQAVLNLIKNACEAMPKEGTLFLQTRFNRDARRLFSQGKRTPVAELVIRDSGTGIKKEHLEDLFTPFFTTKSEGTGLGLMVTQKIIQEHHGVLEINSEKDQGTQVTIYLPFASFKS